MSELVKNQPVSTIGTMVSQDMFEVMEKAYKFSEFISKSDIIPAHYRGKPENVFIAIQTAYRMNLDPMMVMQNTFVLKGKLGMNSSFAIALANSSGLFAGSIRYKITGEGDSLEVTAYATLKSNNEEISYCVGMKEAIADNWTTNPKYKSLPKLMLRYRAATLLIRTHVPEVINGMHMVEEIEDIAAAKDATAPKLTANSKLDDFLAKEEIILEQEDEPYEKLNNLIETYQIPAETIEKWCRRGGIESLKELDSVRIQSCIEWIESNKGNVNQQILEA